MQISKLKFFIRLITWKQDLLLAWLFHLNFLFLISFDVDIYDDRYYSFLINRLFFK